MSKYEKAKKSIDKLRNYNFGYGSGVSLPEQMAWKEMMLALADTLEALIDNV